jgi:ABC-2 type transport system permease protein
VSATALADGRTRGGAGVATQPPLAHVLIPKWRTILTRLRQERDAGGRGKAALLIIVGLVFWVAVFGVLFRVLRYFRGVQEIGALLAGKLLGLSLLSFASVLLLSNVITALSSFYLAKDLDLLVSSPVDWLRIYIAKLLETLVNSSWMVALMAVPIFAAYGIVYHGGPLFPLVALAAFVPYVILPAVIGCAVTTILVNVFPARRTRDLLSIIALGAGAGVIVLFRIIRPEQLARPEGFQNLLDFIAVLRTPTSPLLPSEWVAKAVMGHLTGRPDWLALYLLWTTAAVAVAGGAWLHSRAYHAGFTRAQEGAERFVRGGFWNWSLGTLLKGLGAAKREFVLKDLRLFFRDTTQWSQLILLAALLLVYLFNIRALPLFRGETVPFFLVSVVSFLNLGLAGFVLASIAARFIFPAISLEGRQMWLLRSSPLELRTMLWSKYWVGTIPLMVLALAITVLTNVLLKASPFMMAVGIGTILMLTFAISAMALAFGALYPQFETENAAQIPTSFGGLVFMMATIALLAAVIVIESVPVYRYLRSAFDREPLVITPLMVGSFVLAGAVCVVATIVPLKVALRRMEEFEF